MINLGDFTLEELTEYLKKGYRILTLAECKKEFNKDGAVPPLERKQPGKPHNT